MTTNVEPRDLRPAAGVWTSFRQQAWLLVESRRWLTLTVILLVVLLLLTLNDLPAHIPAIMMVAVFALPAPVIWATTVWAGETPTRRTYHWSLPVARPAHDLARVVAGALYLFAAYAVLAGAGALVAIVEGTFPRFSEIQPVAWANYVLAPLIIYLLVMPIVLWSDYRITRLLFGVTVGLIVFSNVLDWIGLGFAARGIHALIFASEGFGAAMVAGMVPEITSLAGQVPVAADPWLPAALLWLGLGVVFTLFTAVYRPDDLKRLLR